MKGETRNINDAVRIGHDETVALGQIPHNLFHVTEIEPGRIRFSVTAKIKPDTVRGHKYDCNRGDYLW